MEITPRHIIVDNICAKVSIKYGNKFYNEFLQPKDQRIESFVLRWTNYVYGKDHANNIWKKYLTMIIQNKVANKIREAKERAKEKDHSINYLLAKNIVQILNCFIINES